ncbi:hypothetical protein NADFUDRAFT_32096 [Nadsonia fulvescens var. elongata DSM 6958]|uniref:Chloride channel protein n=1 Tax=Nadsonia fulvescens var. elongata DSM 6958 TaxID=857566 RepID=A0A1E3PQB2_9ASCO|nr:hypothetical protein NADFUDRAFT_32096 [Nadsonia fulvescens var. elongata DSM 6958]
MLDFSETSEINERNNSAVPLSEQLLPNDSFVNYETSHYFYNDDSWGQPETDLDASRQSDSSGEFLQRVNAVNSENNSRIVLDNIPEIKRYDEFATIDWIEDSARENMRRRKKQQQYKINSASQWKNNRTRVRYKLYELYSGAQGWIVLMIIGIAIGLIASILTTATEFLSDIKSGYCTKGFYLNRTFCCWEDVESCDKWQPWSYSILNYFIYVLLSTIFAFLSAFLVFEYAPTASGSGISEIKVIVGGFVMKGFLSFWTLVIKSICLPLAIAAGLSVGKEGPSIHYSACVGNVIGRLFPKYKNSATKMKEILTACTAAGVGVAFGSPIGGVLFSVEEISSQFELKTLWRSYFCALVATGTLAATNPYRNGQLVLFQVSYDRDWHFFEIIFFVVIGIFGGIYGILTINLNLRVQTFRKKYLRNYPIREATILALLTGLICYFNQFLAVDMTKSMGKLFHECEGDWGIDDICDPSARGQLVFSLLLATLIRFALVVVTYGCKVPAGIFVPSMAIGAMFGRFMGTLVEMLYTANPDMALFASCKKDVPCITPGTYAFLGAAAALSGIMNITVTVVVIMFELTGALTYILPTMIVVGVTKAITDKLGRGGIADQMIWFSGLPFVDNKAEHYLNQNVEAAADFIRENNGRSDIISLPYSGITLAEINKILNETSFQCYPVIEDGKYMFGFIGRAEILHVLERQKSSGTVSPSTMCIFDSALDRDTSAYSSSSTTDVLDFSSFVNKSPIKVYQGTSLDAVMEIFLKMGPKVIFVTNHKGHILSVLSRKDILRFQFVHEKLEGKITRWEISRNAELVDEKIWEIMRSVFIYCGDLYINIKQKVFSRD